MTEQSPSGALNASAPLPKCLHSSRTERDDVCELNGLRLHLQHEYPPAQDAIRVFRVAVSIVGIPDEDTGDSRNRLLFVGEGAGAEAVRQLARALESADTNAVGGVLPQVVDHWSQQGDSLLLTSNHLEQYTQQGQPQQWRTLGMQTAVEILIHLTTAMVWLHEQSLALGGLELEQLMLNPQQGTAALLHLRPMIALGRLSKSQSLQARQDDINAIGKLLLEVATRSPSSEHMDEILRVLDDAQVLVDKGLARPGLSQLIVGSLIREAPFGYASASELLQGLLQLRAELEPKLTFHTAMASTAGNFPLRRTDQDSCGYSEARVVYHGISRHTGFYCVADGVGGEEHGERASQATVQAALQAFHAALAQYDFHELHHNTSAVARSIVKVAAQHLTILGEAYPNDQRGATTFTGAIIAGDRLGLGHVGDSRAYLIRDRQMIPLTRDHNLANVKAALSEMTGVASPQAQEDARRISRYLSTNTETPLAWIDAFAPNCVPELAEPQPQNNKGDDEYTELPSLEGEESLGGFDDQPQNLGDMDLLSTPRIEITSPATPEQLGQATREALALSASLKLLPGDQIVLMSDGLYGEVDESTMAHHILTARTPNVAAQALLAEAMRELSMDNITVVIIKVGQDGPNLTTAS